MNNAQRNMIDRVKQKLVDIPKTHDEFAMMLAMVVDTKDHETDEREVFNRCAKQYVKLIEQADVISPDGFAYISFVKGKLKQRNYFNKLKKAQEARGIDLIRNLTIALHAAGLIERTELEARATVKGLEWIESDDAIEQSLK